MKTKDELHTELAKVNTVMKWCLKSESAPRINAMLDLARSEPGIPVLPEALDRDPWLLNCPNGTLELKTGTLREHRRADLITKLCPTPYSSNANCPAFERFLDAVFQGDGEVITFVQRFLGYCLTGDVGEQILPIFWGVGSNGKTTLLNAVLSVLGNEYVLTANEDLLVKPKGERHLTELAQLFKVRLVIASETEEGSPLNENRVKGLTGGDRIRARRMREDLWEFDPTHKLILVTNHKPKVRGRDHALWRRLRLVPFEVVFWKPEDYPAGGACLDPRLRADRTIPEKLAAEREGILAWLVRGCLDWQRHGLNTPAKVLTATREYRDAEDLVAQFVAERCVLGQDRYRVRAAELYQTFKLWLKSAGEEEMSQRTFGERIGCLDGVRRHTADGTWYGGIALRPQGTGSVGQENTGAAEPRNL
jgi:putative DNA primase/helicase